MYKAKLISISQTGRMHALALLAIVLLALPVLAAAKTALISTPLGDIEIELLETDAPKTVANFLNYIENNRYSKTFIHRSEPDFVIQGGGFTFIDAAVAGVDTFSPVENEFKISNTRGTVAMAKLSNQPDSATSQWFINLTDNSFLDSQNGGFTVFARVIGDGMEVADAINQLPTLDADGSSASTFDKLPVINYSSGNLIEENLVMTAVSEKLDATPAGPFVMNAGLNDAWYNPNTDGQGFFITVFPDLGVVNLAWFTYDTVLPDETATANLGSPGHRWLTAIGTFEGDHAAAMTIEFASGGLFDTAPGPDDIQRTEDGTMTLTFSDCSSGLVEYDITSINQQGSVPIQRVADDNVVLCEALSGQ
jgi:cyclophilin family peptidyl-prolyl cis-trans isomerase